MAGQGRTEKGCKRIARRSLLRRVTDDRMGSVVLSMMLVLGMLLAYVGVYAKVTKNGYCRARVNSQLHEALVENQRLKADIQVLTSPDRLAQVATAVGMRQCERFDYFRGPSTVVVADAGRN